MKHGLLGLLFVLLLASPAMALPSVSHNSLAWNHSGENIDGFYAYYCDPQGKDGCEVTDYVDAKKVNIDDPSKRKIFIVEALPGNGRSLDSLCFRLTAYKGSAESMFSDEVCGNFGLEAVNSVSIGVAQ